VLLTPVKSNQGKCFSFFGAFFSSGARSFRHAKLGLIHEEQLRRLSERMEPVSGQLLAES
jgi:hypothetical protein